MNFLEMSFLGPIQRLRIWSTICPYFVSEEEQAVRNADILLQSVPIRWYRRMKVQTNKEHNTGYLMDAVRDVTFSKSNKSINIDQQKEGTKEIKSTYTPYFAVESTLNVIDTSDGPALEIVSNKYNFEDGDDASNTNIENDTSNVIMRKVIPFKDMEIATIGETSDWECTIGVKPNANCVVIFARQKKNKSNVLKDEDNERIRIAQSQIRNNPSISESTFKMRKILSFQLSPDTKLSLSRDEAIRHLNALISWDKINPFISSGRAFGCTAIGGFNNCAQNNCTNTSVQINTRDDDNITLPPTTILKNPPSPTSVLTGFSVDGMTTSVDEMTTNTDDSAAASIESEERRDSPSISDHFEQSQPIAIENQVAKSQKKKEKKISLKNIRAILSGNRSDEEGIKSAPSTDEILSDLNQEKYASF